MELEGSLQYKSFHGGAHSDYGLLCPLTMKMNAGSIFKTLVSTYMNIQFHNHNLKFITVFELILSHLTVVQVLIVHFLRPSSILSHVSDYRHGA
jgi:hypothetical protein